MPHAPLISKIRCHNPNKNKSRVCNRNYLIYIGTREGVDLSASHQYESLIENLADERMSTEAANELYAKYIAERPKSHGLFGNIDVSDIKQVGNHLADLTARNVNVYRGIVSLSAEDAIELGYTDKDKWVQYIRSTIPDVAKEFKIPIDQLRWTAAVHMEKSHPHCHYMFWSEQDMVTSPYIHVSKQDRIREKLSAEMFKAEREQAVIDKTLHRDTLINEAKDILSAELEKLTLKSNPIMERISNNTLENYGEKLITLAHQMPTEGRLAYKLLPPDKKALVDQFVNDILSTPVLQKEYHKFTASVDKLSKTYSASPAHTQVTLNKANEDIKKRLANIALKSCRQIQYEESLQKHLHKQQINTSRYIGFKCFNAMFTTLANSTRQTNSYATIQQYRNKSKEAQKAMATRKGLYTEKT